MSCVLGQFGIQSIRTHSASFFARRWLNQHRCLMSRCTTRLYRRTHRIDRRTISIKRGLLTIFTHRNIFYLTPLDDLWRFSPSVNALLALQHTKWRQVSRRTLQSRMTLRENKERTQDHNRGVFVRVFEERLPKKISLLPNKRNKCHPSHWDIPPAT